MDFWTTIVTGVIAGVVTGLILKVLERSFDEGRVQRVLMAAKGVLFFTAIPWIVSAAFFYTKDPAAGSQPITAETVLEALAYVFWKGISPFGRLLIAAGVATGLVLGIWYPDKLREVIDSLEGKQQPADGAEQKAKDAADSDGPAA